MVLSLSYNDILTVVCQIICIEIITPSERQAIIHAMVSSQPSMLQHVLKMVYVHSFIGGKNLSKNLKYVHIRLCRFIINIIVAVIISMLHYAAIAVNRLHSVYSVHGIKVTH